MRITDRYIVREVIPPFLLALLVFTFILEIPPIMEQAEKLIAKGVPWPTVGRILLTLLPQALGLTIPIAFLVGLLISLGRMSADRETVALLACGVSLYRILAPILVLAAAAAGATLYVMVVAIPDANQTFRQITYDIVAAKAENDIQPRVFYTDFPGWTLYVRDTPAGAPGWRGVFLADTREPNRTVVYVAERGRLVLDRAKQTVTLVLENGSGHTTRLDPPNPPTVQLQRFEGPGGQLLLGLDPQSVFSRVTLERGLNEMTIADLQAQARLKVKNGLSPHNEIMTVQQKFSIPVACLVFGVIAVALGVTTRRDGKLAGFVLGIMVVFTYYVVWQVAEAAAKGSHFPAVLARWMPDIVLGPLGIAALIWRARGTEGNLPLPLPSFRRPEQQVTVSAPSASGHRVVVVIRVPQFWVPRANILDWYIAKLYLKIVGITFVGLMGLMYISTVVDLSEKLFKGQAGATEMLKYLVYQTPQFIYWMVPLSALVGTLITIGILTRTSELAVMKACGISLYRVAVPLLLMAVTWSVLLFGLGERVLAQSRRQAEVLNAKMRGRPSPVFNVASRRWVVGRNGDIYHYAYFSQSRKELSNLTMYRFVPGTWKLAGETWTRSAQYDGGWRAQGGWTQQFEHTPPGGPEVFAARTLTLEPPDYFEAEPPDPELMTLEELNHYIQELEPSGVNVVPYRVALHRKVAFPLVTLIMTLLAVPFAVTTGRGGTMYGIGLGIALAIVYWLLGSAFAAIGNAGLLTPVLAGWAPNILFAAGALYLILTVRT